MAAVDVVVNGLVLAAVSNGTVVVVAVSITVVWVGEAMTEVGLVVVTGVVTALA